jgi:hypothetical protein
MLTFSYLADSSHSDDEGDMFLRNVGSYKSCKASHLRKLHSSGSVFFNETIFRNFLLEGIFHDLVMQQNEIAQTTKTLVDAWD